ncbi:hypothetical protein LEP1GSC103_0394 [Leptospira borgpetersenii serovar Javanica str. UI 09931]|uniref:Uncharacterized protein n=5 Tax=Leptospira borgpetersenii TaxID=174 RepID=M3GFJ5_LEPBO|nr:hypothetical protein LBBP_03205 [Leptospira borgpetersenii serovar Ballum]EKP14456.1 hypothetical protein LEP1GSC128_1552 [Leptospira borgpetersenii str. 200801926]EKQ92542.1 hypothetical protein LEP1GSC101_2799 [Leptospira borgpetersenii str. UI 09149]EKQ99750.1 hypothetical protein LEP1GSC121_2092 [Leptospira borgpetersenii serovar Castellonis str. 200801910]EMF99731.1 hypothetical protein LEP1GSC123_2657 [Leptospira borgpetersenii str. 200701203]EMK12408.1 hypothetical protein LEP1GSC066
MQRYLKKWYQSKKPGNVKKAEPEFFPLVKVLYNGGIQ